MKEHRERHTAKSFIEQTRELRRWGDEWGWQLWLLECDDQNDFLRAAEATNPIGTLRVRKTEGNPERAHFILLPWSD
jgi:hypothetical protein